MLVIGELRPQAIEFEQVDVKAVDLTPWRLVKPAGILLIVAVFAIYGTFADFSVLIPPPVKELSGIRQHTPVDEGLIPTGEVASATGAPFHFKTEPGIRRVSPRHF